MDAPNTNEDVLVVLQTENGQQIALPKSALPNDFVPGDSGQIIMVESALDEQQEVVVESVDTNTDNIVSLQVDSNIQLTSIQPVTPVNPPVPHKKQKRKETLLTRPLNEEDLELHFQVIEEPIVQDIQKKRKPRKEYRTKKRVKMAIEKLSKPSPADQDLPQPTTPQPIPERRTRLSNTCRVATGKSYKCNDCDFSTERINNIILHVKESCPKLKRAGRTV